MPSPLLFRDEKSEHRRTDLSKSQSLHDQKQENAMGSLDAALQRISQRRQSERAASCISDQKSVHSMIEMRQVPRVMSKSLTTPRGNELSMFTIKWNNGASKNRRQSIEFEGDFDADDWGSDADSDSETKSSRASTSLTLEHALSFRSLSWNPCGDDDDDDDDASQSSMSCSSVSSTMSKSRGRRPRLIRSGSLKDTSSKALEYMQHRSCLQQSLLRVKNKKPKRRHSSDQNCDKLSKEGEERPSRRLSRQKSDRSKDGPETKSQATSSRRQPRSRSHDLSDDPDTNKSLEKSINSATIRSTKTSQQGSSRSYKVSKTDSKEESKSHPHHENSVEKRSKVPPECPTNRRKEKTNVKKSDALRSSKELHHRRSSSKTESCDIHNSLSRKKDSGPFDTTAPQKKDKSTSSRRASSNPKCTSSMKIKDILATPDLMESDDSPWKVTRQRGALCTKNRV